MGLGAEEFVASVIPASVVAAIMYTLFLVLRPHNANVYEARIKLAGSQPDNDARVQPLPRGLFAWLLPLLRVDDAQLVRSGGVDVAAHVILMRTLVQIFTGSAVLCCCVMCPIYSAGDNGLDDFDSGSMANVEPNGWHLWVGAAMVWPVTGLTCGLIYYALNRIVKLREEAETLFLDARHFVVLVRYVPKHARHTSAIRDHFEKLFPGQVFFVQPVKCLGKQYEKNVGKYVKAWRAWKNAEAAIEANPRKTPMMKLGPLGLWGKQVETIAHQKGLCEELRPLIEKRRSEFDKVDCSSCAFVAFRTLNAASKVIEMKVWGCVPSPEPRELIWPNLQRTPPEMVHRALAVAVCLLVALISFGIVPVCAFAQGLVNLEDLAREFVFFEPVLRLPAAALAIVQGFLPIIVVIVIYALVVPLFTFLAIYIAGSIDAKTMHSWVFWSYFWFQFLTGFLATIVSGAVFNQIPEMVKDPMRLANLLGESVPKVGTFFIIFVMVRALSDASVKIALLAQLVLSKVLLKFAKTDYERDEILDPAVLNIGQDSGGDLFIFLICMSYTIVAPIITLFGLLYFTLNLVADKYLKAYVYRTEFDSMGLFTVGFFRGVLICAFIGQLLIILVVALKYSLSWILVIPPMLLTFVLALLLPHVGYGRRLARQELPKHLVAELEAVHIQCKTLEKLEKAHMNGDFAQPSFALNLDYPVGRRFGKVEFDR